jgi:hypothetical protein
MEHRTLEEIKRVADVSPRDLARRTMSRRERLERWATVLENHGHGSLNALRRIEFLPEDERMLVRADNSPLSLAAQDPILAAEGLASDRLGDAINFFELRQEEAHYLLCDCHFHGSMTASNVAWRVRAVGRRNIVREFWDRAFGVA